MDRADSFERPTATPAALAPWVRELAGSLGGLAMSYLPGGPLDPRTREQVMVAVTEVNGCRYSAWIHGNWADFVGPAERADATDALLAYARECAEAGRPSDPAPLHDVLPPDAVAAVRATVAQVEVANLIGNTADGLLARIARRRPFDPRSALREAVTVAVAAPVALPLLALGTVMRTANRLAPTLPVIEMPPGDEANLMVHLLAEAAPAYLSGTTLRSFVLGLPFPVTIALRTGRTAATVQFGRGRLVLVNGVRADAWLVVEGEVEPLLRSASGALVREFGTIRIRPN